MFVVQPTRELAATVVAMRAAGPTLKAALLKYSDLYMRPAWTGSLAARPGSRTQRRVMNAGAIAYAYPDGFTMLAANTSTPLSGGAVPNELGRAFEFGTAEREPRTYSRRSPKGTVHRVTRVTTAQMPTRSRSGWIVFPAARVIGPRLLSLWSQTVKRTLADAVDGINS